MRKRTRMKLTFDQMVIQRHEFTLRLPDGESLDFAMQALSVSELAELDHNLNPYPRAPLATNDPQPYVRIGKQVYEKIDFQAESYRRAVKEWKDRRTDLLILLSLQDVEIPGETTDDKLANYRRIEPSIREGFRLAADRIYGTEVLAADGFRGESASAEQPVLEDEDVSE